MKKLFALTLLALSVAAHAEVSAAKKELVAKVLQLQQPLIETVARNLAQAPALQTMQQAGFLLQTQVAPDKRQVVAKEIQADLTKYIDDAVPLVRQRALKLAPSTIGAVLEEKFSEEELTQLIAIIESPAFRKFNQLGNEMQKALSEKLVAEMQPTIAPKVKALEQSITKRLGVPAKAPAN